MPQASRFLTLFAALVALALAATPASATFFSFNLDSRWLSDTDRIYGSGVVESAGVGILPVTLISGGLFVQHYEPAPGGSVFCNIYPETCTTHGPEGAGITTISWNSPSLGGGLTFQFVQPPNFVSSVPAQETPAPLAVPGPIAGTGLPVLAGLLAAWGFLRRRGRAE